MSEPETICAGLFLAPRGNVLLCTPLSRGFGESERPSPPKRCLACLTPSVSPRCAMRPMASISLGAPSTSRESAVDVAVLHSMVPDSL